MKKDLFGFDTQGVKYDLYRPKYPSDMLKKMILRIKNKNRYLDIATGTGQILFQVCNNFKQSQGLDISKKMIQVCEQKSMKYNNLQFRCQDFMTTQLIHKYDLITIGQALHWLPIKQFLIKSRDSLQKQGILVVLGYILNKVEGSTLEQTNNLSQLFNNFYDKKVKKNFDFDRDELHTHYSNVERYPFNDVFKNVQRQVVQVPIQMDKHGFLSYLKTFSGYNTYLQRFPNQLDPIKEMQTKIDQKQKIKCIFDYFSVTCSM